MAIRINSNADNVTGALHVSIGSFSAAFSGTYTSPNETVIDGSLNRALGSFKVRLTDGPSYPRVSCYNLGKNWGLEDAASQAQREALSKCEVVVLQPHRGSQIDGSGDPGWLGRAEIVQDILDRAAANNNPGIRIFFYQNAMETGTTSTYGQKLLSETGPGYPVNDDWFARNSSGTLMSGNFGPLVNLTDYVQADAQGLYAGDWYAINQTQTLLDEMIVAGIPIGPGGLAGVFWDNFQFYLSVSNTDLNAANGNEDGQDYYDPNNADHVFQDPDAVNVVGRWRWGYQNCFNEVEFNNPQIVQLVNGDTWVRRSNSYSGALPNPNTVMPEYRDGGEFTAKAQGGIMERGIAWSGFFPRSGVDFDGVNSVSGSWQSMYNGYEYLDRVMRAPSLAMLSADIKGAKRPTPNVTNDGLGGRDFPVWDEELDSNAKHNVIRWALATACMANGCYNLNILDVNATDDQGNYQTCVFSDETGLIHTATTGLYRGWLGSPIDDKQIAATFGDIYVRHFENGTVVLNTGNDASGSAETVTLAIAGIGAGTHRRMQGVDDPTHNDGSVVNGSFSLNQVDALFLLKRSVFG